MEYALYKCEEKHNFNLVHRHERAEGLQPWRFHSGGASPKRRAFLTMSKSSDCE